MYYLLKEKGLLKDIDENMGIEFLDLDKIITQKQSYVTTLESSSMGTL